MKFRIQSVVPALLLLVSGAVGAVDLPVKTGSGYVSPTEVPGVKSVSASEAYELWQNRAWFVDPRKPSEYDAGRIPGALGIEYDPDPNQSAGLPDQVLTEASLSAEIGKDEPVVFYCNAEGCDRSSWAAALAAEWGWQEVYYFRDGIPGWTKAGYTIE